MDFMAFFADKEDRRTRGLVGWADPIRSDNSPLMRGTGRKEVAETVDLSPISSTQAPMGLYWSPTWFFRPLICIYRT